MPRQPAHRWAVHPRWRGEQPLYGSNGEKTSGSSPLARGTADDEQRRLMWGRFIPAGAGNRPSRRRVSRSASVHPRWRGEQIVLLNRQIDERGSSPLARGTVCASVRIESRPSVHPRWRGEQALTLIGMRTLSGSSPLARGTEICAKAELARIPVHPRWRGEQPWTHATAGATRGSSPLARGTAMKPTDPQAP